jgi:MerR family transcriptional regulator, heat shock protein HspR
MTRQAHRTLTPTSGERRRDELTRPRYFISIAAELASCHPRTLRIYEEEGLVQPQRRNNLRLYSEADIQRVRIIRFLTRRQRVNLAGVRVILQLEALGKIRVYDLFDEDDVERFADETPEADESDEPELVEGATRRGN